MVRLDPEYAWGRPMDQRQRKPKQFTLTFRLGEFGNIGNRVEKPVSGVLNHVLTTANRARVADQPPGVLAWRTKTRGETLKRAWTRAQAAEGDAGAAGGRAARGAGKGASGKGRGGKSGKGRGRGAAYKEHSKWGRSPPHAKVVSGFGASQGWYQPMLRRSAGEICWATIHFTHVHTTLLQTSSLSDTSVHVPSGTVGLSLGWNSRCRP